LIDTNDGGEPSPTAGEGGKITEGRTIERIEKELFARQDRDETVRFGASANPLRR
jgi:hypothetical protein